MPEIVSILSVGIGTLLAIVVAGVIVFWFIEDVTQKKHAVLRNYPVIGRLRYFFEKQGEYFRQYFFAGDRDEMPFNRATRARSEEHTSELQSRGHLVCRLLLEKKNQT